jgi:hypothetical protein
VALNFGRRTDINAGTARRASTKQKWIKKQDEGKGIGWAKDSKSRKNYTCRPLRELGRLWWKENPVRTVTGASLCSALDQLKMHESYRKIKLTQAIYHGQ